MYSIKQMPLLICGGEHFKASGNIVVDKGYTILYESQKRKEEQPVATVTRRATADRYIITKSYLK